MACSRPPSQPSEAPKKAEPVRITQFYATAPVLRPGEKELVCYGVENAKTVWLSPPRHEVSAALSRCVEVSPSATTTYTLTAEGADGQHASKDVTVTMGKPRARIIEVKVSSVNVKRGEAVSICYRVENARVVEIEPLRYRAVAKNDGCTMDTPQRTTTYVVSAVGEDGEGDHERVTVTVR